MAQIEADLIFSTELDAAGQPVRFPSGNGRIEATVYNIPPGVSLPVHKHIFPRMGYVLSGTLRVTNADTRQVATYEAGDCALEAVGVWHEGKNVGDGPVRILVIDLIEPGAQNVVLR